MVYFMEHSIKEINEKGQTAVGMSDEDKSKIAKLEQQFADLNDAIERGLNV